MLPQGLAGALGGAGFPIDTRSAEPLGGGDTHRSCRVRSRSGERFFLKFAPDPATLPVFEAEREGLEALAGAGTLRIPQPLATGATDNAAFLLLEYLELGGPKPRALPALGAGLAGLHRHTGPRFGWHRDNTIGATPQANGWQDDWVDFFRERRLGCQLGLAVARGHGGDLAGPGEELLAVLPRFFTGYRPVPALLHGDLWGGNWGATPAGEPVMFDPAVYYGDREADLAMTELFGGFGREFYRAYDSAWPRDPGYPLRRDLYNLYHVLNHLNLFGGAYLAQAKAMLARLLAEVA